MTSRSGRGRWQRVLAAREQARRFYLGHGGYPAMVWAEAKKG